MTADQADYLSISTPFYCENCRRIDAPAEIPVDGKPACRHCGSTRVRDAATLHTLRAVRVDAERVKAAEASKGRLGLDSQPGDIVWLRGIQHNAVPPAPTVGAGDDLDAESSAVERAARTRPVGKLTPMAAHSAPRFPWFTVAVIAASYIAIYLLGVWMGT